VPRIGLYAQFLTHVPDLHIHRGDEGWWCVVCGV
jgi:hypothetical protein